jgi:hypothetical protein
MIAVTSLVNVPALLAVKGKQALTLPPQLPHQVHGLPVDSSIRGI